MVLTPLEAIAEKLKEKNDAALESILSVSGSSAIAKNEYNVTVVDNTNIASSLVFKPLNKTKLDDVELVKAIDTEVKELKPDIPKINLDLVPRPLYTEKVVENEDLRKQVTDLTLSVSTLKQEVSDLKSQVQTEINNRLSIEQTNDVLVNQLDTLGATVQDFTGQIAISLQKSVDESILRTSLQAQNTGFKAQIEALIKQIDSLNSIIEGLQSQLGAIQQQQAIQQSTSNLAAASGGDALVKSIIVKWEGAKNRTDLGPKGLSGKINAKNYGETKFELGGQLVLTNNDTQPVKISIEHKAAKGWNWLTIPNNNFEIAASGNQTIDFKINANAVPGNAESERKTFLGATVGWGNTTDYKGTIKVTATKSDGTTESKEYPCNIVKANPGSY
jgi:regulator of replication initiation timing